MKEVIILAQAPRVEEEVVAVPASEKEAIEGIKVVAEEERAKKAKEKEEEEKEKK